MREEIIINVLNKYKEEISDGYSFYGAEVTEDVLRKIAKDILMGLDAIENVHRARRDEVK